LNARHAVFRAGRPAPGPWIRRSVPGGTHAVRPSPRTRGGLRASATLTI
jgi:hypothetical protein